LLWPRHLSALLGAFRARESVWISEHQDLLGDQRLGPSAAAFLPTRFNIAGEALDAKGFAASSLLPALSLGVPRPFLELEPLFLSVFGLPQRQSYLLAAMTWSCAASAARFRRRISDADPTSTGY